MISPHSAFPHPVKVGAYQFAIGIQYRTSGVTSGSVVAGQESYRQIAVGIRIATEVIAL